MAIRNPWLHKTHFTAKDVALLAMGKNPSDKMTDPAQEIAKQAEKDMRDGVLAKKTIVEVTERWRVEAGEIKKLTNDMNVSLDQIEVKNKNDGRTSLIRGVIAIGTGYLTRHSLIKEVHIHRNDWRDWFQYRYSEVPSFLDDGGGSSKNNMVIEGTVVIEALDGQKDEKRLFLIDYKNTREENPHKKRSQIVEEISILYPDIGKPTLEGWAKIADKEDGVRRSPGRRRGSING